MNSLFPYFLSAVWFFLGVLVVRPDDLSCRRVQDSIPWLYGVGLALSCYGLFLINLCGLVLTSARVASLLFLGTTAGGLWWLKTRPRRALAIPKDFLEAPSAVLLICMLTILLAGWTAWMEASALPIYHLDAVAHFGLDAKILFYKGSFRVAHFFQPEIIHRGANFPLLVPYFQATLYWLLRAVDDLTVRHLYLVLGIAWLMMLNQRLRQVVPLNSRWSMLAVLATLPVFFVDDDSQLVSGSSDPVMAFFWTGVVLSALYFLEQRNTKWLLTMVAFSVGCIFSKPNGLLLCGLAWALLWAFHRKKVGFYAGILFLIILPWLWERHLLPVDTTLPPAPFITWNHVVPRIPGLFVGTMKEISNIKHWGLFWFFIAVGIAGQTASDRGTRYLRYLLALNVGLYAVYFLIEPRPIDWLLQASLSRWLLHITPLALLLAANFWIDDPKAARSAFVPDALNSPPLGPYRRT